MFGMSCGQRLSATASVIAEPSPSRLRRQAIARGLRGVGGMEILRGQLNLLFAALVASSRVTQGVHRYDAIRFQASDDSDGRSQSSRRHGRRGDACRAAPWLPADMVGVAEDDAAAGQAS